jgi:UDP-N-acetylmuramate: L-alanyl-gamma-D-glutamyl-meso-diaminopimelate ligase
MPRFYNQQAIPEGERFSAEKLMADLKSKGCQASLCESVDQIVGELKSQAKPGDVILIMSNGGFDGIYGKLLTQLA